MLYYTKIKNKRFLNHQEGKSMNPKQSFYETQAETIIRNLNKRHMEGFFCATAAEAAEKASSLVAEGSTVSFGGSMSLSESGVMDMLRSRSDIRLIDRSLAKTPEEVRQVYLDAFCSDTYFMSTNAITLDGQLVNIDGNGNRVAALIYGPLQVILIVGMNKVVANADDAIRRVHNTATPPNCIRLDKKTPCAATGACADCLGDDCICSQTVITRFNRTPGRIKIILVGEQLGY